VSIIKQEWWCKVDESCGRESQLQKEQEQGFWRKVWEFIKLLFIWID